MCLGRSSTQPALVTARQFPDIAAAAVKGVRSLVRQFEAPFFEITDRVGDAGLDVPRAVVLGLLQLHRPGHKLALVHGGNHGRVVALDDVADFLQLVLLGQWRRGFPAGIFLKAWRTEQVPNHMPSAASDQHTSRFAGS